MTNFTIAIEEGAERADAKRRTLPPASAKKLVAALRRFAERNPDVSERAMDRLAELALRVDDREVRAAIADAIGGPDAAVQRARELVAKRGA